MKLLDLDNTKKDKDIEWIVKKYQSGMGMREIGRLCNLDHETIRRRLANNGVKIRNRGGYQLKTEDKIALDHQHSNNGTRLHSIESRLDKVESEIGQCLEELGIKDMEPQE